ncbi:MAG TPA: substrate-binding domain-containing protein [Sphingobacteriaceae bacterium]|nr:substrate-binding domain-containing protein [Sphingobacteriaceae bacterium]
MKKIKYYILMFCLFANGCGNKPEVTEQTYTSGIVKIVVDESFEPIIEDQLYVFENTYTKAKIDVLYKPENELLNLFLSDSIQVAILSRKLKPAESRFYENKKINIRVNRFAIDGIALITNKSNADSTAKVDDILAVLKGKPGNIKSLVFDNANSSTVRYLKELAGVSALPSSGVYAMKSNPEVIRYVHANPSAVGVVGVNWLKQPDADLEEILKSLKVIPIKNLPGRSGSDKFYKPTQSNIASGLYPLIRELYIINCEGGPGLGTGFASFLAGEQGQRIVLKSGLVPDSIPSRQIIIRKKI